ncbi:hypothetical protein [Allocoleopsis sp.]|uniref:hypothetical protein n=1 Tax=Allocoleopsis sp. TaxID=3088169 RepID=UPI002FD34F61
MKHVLLPDKEPLNITEFLQLVVQRLSGLPSLTTCARLPWLGKRSALTLKTVY